MQLRPSDSVESRVRIQQRYALRTLWFQQQTDTGTWKDKSGWLNARIDGIDNECDWYGVTCEPQQHEASHQNGNPATNNATFMVVVELIFIVHNLRGVIPPDLGLLPFLRTFYVPGNFLAGTIPASLNQWTQLEIFDVTANRLMGTFPASFDTWTRLQVCYIRDNFLTGTLPNSIGSWANLTYITVQKNMFHGTIPSAVELWSNMLWAFFDGNNFTGSVPMGICRIHSLQVLQADCTSKLECGCCTSCT